MAHTTSAAGSLVSSITDLVTGLFATLFGLLHTIFALVQDVFSGAFHVVAAGLKGVFAVFTHVFSAALDLVTGLVKVKRHACYRELLLTIELLGCCGPSRRRGRLRSSKFCSSGGRRC